MTVSHSVPAQLRRWLVILTVLCGFALTMQPALAQDTQVKTPDEPVATETVTAAAAPEADAPSTEAVTQEPKVDMNAGFDLDDPAIQEALEQKEAAEKALVDAINAQVEEQRKAQSLEDSAADTGVKKPSFIPTSAEEAKALAKKIWDKILGWLSSPPFLAQLGAIVAAWLISPFIAKRLRRAIFLFRDPPKPGDKLRVLRHYLYEARELLRPALLIALLSVFAIALKSSLGQDWLVKLAQSLAVVFLLYKAIKQFAPNELFKKLGNFILIPLALLITFGKYDDLLTFLDSIGLGGMSLLTVIKLGLFGGLFFWLGNIGNTKGQTALRSQETMDSGIREIIAKFLQIAIFATAAIMALSASGIGLGGLVVIFSALSLGVGLGLQPIAANFVSGLIILFDRSVKVGDYVVLPDGQEGFVEAINMRSTTVETTDGKDIMVPNTQFTEDAYENWTHKDPSQRYEVEFLVSYDTDLDSLEGILMPAILNYDQLLRTPEEPDLEFRKFEDHGIKMAIEFWADGVDDGPNKFTSDIGFIIWRTLKANNIQMPLPQRVVRTIK